MQIPSPLPERAAFTTPAAPAILANVEGSFAWEVLHRRHPVLIEHLIKLHPYPPSIRDRLATLCRELVDRPIGNLPDNAHDRAAWDAWGASCYGLPWPDAPSLWAESYFHRRVLEAVAFFDPGTWYHIDPFTPIKEADLGGTVLADDLQALAELTRLPASEGTLALLLATLWGNQLDLGFRMGMAAVSGWGGTSARLVVDHTSAICDLLHVGAPGQICIVADNAGRELLADLALVDHLLRHYLASHVTLQVKPYPHFVSDAVPADVMTCLRVLVQPPEPAGAVGRRLIRAIRDGRLTITAHWFFCSPQSFHHLPEDLIGEYADADLTVLKGDLNYRRLVGDCHWPPDIEFAKVTSYFPSPVAALRVHKSEVVVGVEAARVSQLAAEDIGWRIDGRYGTAQLRG
ncbi:damage-control phosphatase ARMT1 family protein [Micromonospora sp. NPDC005413]|uniref:damage-control phosphatase ARMT1 family protein n=1 Tax=Micromonospora sp. NPDC005413 TaxID=3154563 RepID=UPI0033B9AE46